MITILIIVVLCVFLFGLYQKNTNRFCTSRIRLDGKMALVTGGTAGLGLEIAKDFATRGAKVIIACPFEQEGIDAIEEIIKVSDNKKVIFKLLDLASFDSVRKFAADILNTEERLDILVNNAGVGIPEDRLTEDGLSYILQVNFFGHFLLDLKLLPLLCKTGKPTEPSRIVNTSSVLHYLGYLDANKLAKPCNPTLLQKVYKYSDSKFFFIPYSRELTKMIKDINANVVVNNVDPGAVGTRIFYSAGPLLGIILDKLFNLLFKTPKEGAQTSIFVALDKKAGEVSGEIFRNCKLSRAKTSAYDETIATKLWKESLRLVEMEDNELSQLFNAS